MKFETISNQLNYFEKKKIQGAYESVLYWLNTNPEETIVLDQFKKIIFDTKNNKQCNQNNQ